MAGAGPGDGGGSVIANPRRLRCEAHRRFVATIPCVVCRNGLIPEREWFDRGAVSQAAHIGFAQPSARGLKVSDEFVVPLCPAHHDPRSRVSVHFWGDERGWWQVARIDPLPIAAILWAASIAARRVNQKILKEAA